MRLGLSELSPPLFVPVVDMHTPSSFGLGELRSCSVPIYSHGDDLYDPVPLATCKEHCLHDCLHQNRAAAECSGAERRRTILKILRCAVHHPPDRHFWRAQRSARKVFDHTHLLPARIRRVLNPFGLPSAARLERCSNLRGRLVAQLTHARAKGVQLMRVDPVITAHEPCLAVRLQVVPTRSVKAAVEAGRGAVLVHEGASRGDGHARPRSAARPLHVRKHAQRLPPREEGLSEARRMRARAWTRTTRS
eukprot:6173632-Pleurochrysis_carterae.AAC.10